MAGGKRGGRAPGGGRGGAPGADGSETAAGSEPGPSQAAQGDPQQDAQPSQPAAASSGAQGGKASGGRSGTAAPAVKQPQLDAKGLREIKTAFQQFCRGDVREVTKLVNGQEASRMTYLLRTRLLLSEACHCAAQEKQLIKLDFELQAAVYGALDIAVSAAAHGQQPSLLGAAYAITLLRVLHGRPAFDLRHAQWQRLADRFPPPLRQELTAAHFVPADQEALSAGVAEMEWPLDAAVLAARNKVNGLAAWEAQQIAELQRVLDEGLADDQRESEEWVDLYQNNLEHGKEALRGLGLEQIHEMMLAVTHRLAKVKMLLPARYSRVLLTRLNNERHHLTEAMELERRQRLEQAQRQQQQHGTRRILRVKQLQQGVRQMLAQAGSLSSEEQQRLVQEVARAGVKAAQLANYLSAELQAAGEGAGCSSGSGGRDNPQLEAMLRLSSMSLTDLRLQLARTAPPDKSGLEQAAALACYADAMRALRDVMEGRARVEYCLPVEQPARSSQGMPRRDFQHTALSLAGRRDLLRACPEMFERADLGDILQLLSAGDGLPTELPAKAPSHLSDVDVLELEIPASLSRLQHLRVHPDDVEVLLEVPRWRSPLGAGAPAPGTLQCTDDPPTRFLYGLLHQARLATHKLGDVVRDRGLELLLSRVQRPPGVVEVDATLAKVLAGHLLLEAFLEQDEAAATAAAGRSGRGGIPSDSDSTDSEGEEGQPFTARSTAGAIPAERAGRLARLQLALDAPPSDVVHLLIMHCLQEQSARLAAANVVNTLRQHVGEAQCAFFPLEEGGQLLLALLPHQLPTLTVGGAPPDQDEAMQALTEARGATLENILAALRLLQSHGRLPSLLALHLQGFVQTAAEHRGVQPAGAGGQGEAGAASEGSTAGELSLEILAQLPLRDLLNLYSLLCTWLADTFPAGPAELGPAFEEAIVLAAAGSSITPPTEPLAGGRPAAQLSLTQLGLCQMVARTQAFEEPEDHLHPLLLRQHQRRLPLRRLQPSACADSLASCAGGLSTAVEAALATVDERTAGGEFALHISQLAIARWWHEVLGRSIASMQLEMEALHRIAFRAAHMAKANWEGFAVNDPEGVRQLFCGSPGKPGLIEETQQACMHASTKYCSAMFDAELVQLALLALGQRLSSAMVQQDLLLLLDSSDDVRQAAAPLRETASKQGQELRTKLTALGTAAAEHLPVPTARELAAEVTKRRLQLGRLQEAAATCSNPQLVLLANRFAAELRELQSSLQGMVQEVVGACQQLALLHWAATNKVHAVLGHICFKAATCPLALLTRHMVEHALPERWEQELKAQQELQRQQKQQQSEALPPLPPEAPQAAQEEAPSAPPLPSAAAARSGSTAAASSSSSQPVERRRGQRGHRGKTAAAAEQPPQQLVSEEELKRQEAEREAALKALLDQEEQEAQRKAKQQQKQEESKKKAAQHNAAQQAAEAKRKAEEEAAAKAAAAQAAEEAAREAERQWQRQEEEERLAKQNLEALNASARTAVEERRAKAAEAAAERAAAAERKAEQKAATAAGKRQLDAGQPAAAPTPQPRPTREKRGGRQGRDADKPATGAAVLDSAAGAELREAGSSRQRTAASKGPDTAAHRAQAASVAAEPETPAPSAVAAGKRRGSGAVAEHAAAASEAAAVRQAADGQPAVGAAAAVVQPASAQQAQQGKSRRQPKAPSPQHEQAPEQPRPDAAAPAPPQQQTQQRQQQQPAQPGRQRGRGRAEQPASAAQVPSWHKEEDDLTAELAALPLGPDGEPEPAAVEALFRRHEARRAGRPVLPPPPTAAGPVPGSWAAGAAGPQAGRQPAGPAAASHGVQAAPLGPAVCSWTALGSGTGASRVQQPPAEQRQEPARFVSWSGAWVCRCGKQHPRLEDSCDCGMPDPCRRWFYGEDCLAGGRRSCRRSHLLFALPDRPSPQERFGAHKLRPLDLKPDPKDVYTPPPKPAARPRGPAREALLPTFSAAPAGGQRPTAPTPVEDPRLPAGPWNARPRPLAEAATDSTTGSGAPVSVVYSEPAPVPQHQQQQAAEARPPVPPLGGYQPAAELPALAQLFPPQRQPPGAALAAAHAAGAASLPAVTPLPPSVAAAAAAAAAAGAAADDDMDLDGLLAGLGVGSSSVELQAPPPVPGPLHQMPALLPNAGGWGTGGASSMPASAQQQQQQPPPLWGAPAGTPWGAAEAPASAPPAPASLQAQHAQQGSWPVAAEQEEDAEMAAAIRASMASASASAAQQQAGAWHQAGGHAQQEAAGSAPAESAGGEVALPGMRNEAGEYNCFINVIIQCLWRCAEFRHQVAGWDAAFRAADPVLDAVFNLFQQFEAQEAARRAGGALVAVDPSPLREALAALPGHNFRVGEMNDAAEVLLCIYEKAMDAAKALGRASGIDKTFGLQVQESVNCSRCRRVTQHNSYIQYFYNTQATTLRTLSALHTPLGELLADDAAQHPKSCDTDMGGCGQPNPVTHVLQAAPRVFTLQVAWESHNEAPADIAGTLAAIRDVVDVGEVYRGVPPGLHRYTLRSMVCYYGAHYQALVLVPDAGGWLMFDDTRVSRVGDWSMVCRKCEAGRIQPAVLFYEALPLAG